MSALRPAGDVRGAKGGGREPVDERDTLRSTQRGEIVDLLGEGRIAGLVNGLKSVYLDGVPVENADGSRNFEGFDYLVSLGGPTKSGGLPPQAFRDVATEVAVGVGVTKAVPVVRTISDADATSVRVTISMSALMEMRGNGDRVGSSFEWAIDVQSAGGGYVERYRQTLAGKASSAYFRAVLVDLKPLGPAPWDIRVRRVSNDSGDANVVNAFAWAGYTILKGVRVTYRNSAVIGITFSAKNFSAVPRRAYDVMGVDDWDVPSNYNPRTRVYAGLWSGTFVQDWTNNPAWVFWNLVTNHRYGLGEYVAQAPDKWLLYRLAQWCDAPVPDGRGGTEPRYTFNGVLATQREALAVLQDIAALFRGAILYGAGALGVCWDAPGAPTAIYTPANVVDGLISYGDGSRAQKKSSCTCWYTDISQSGADAAVTWDDPDLVQKYGLRGLEIRPIGVTSPGQALRHAKWALYTTEYEDQTCSFMLGEEGAAGRIGDVFQVSDPAETGERLGGRISAATTTAVTLDAPVTLLAGETYTLWVTAADPADGAKLQAASRPVVTSPGVASVLAVSPAFPAAPPAGTMWVLEASTAVPTLWRYAAIEEERNGTSGMRYRVTGVRHYPDKWALIEANQPMTIRPTRRLSDAAPKPTGLAVAEAAYMDGAQAMIRADISWDMPAPGLRYQVQWRLALGPWQTEPTTSMNTVDVDGLQAGLFDVRVKSINVLDAVSPAAELSVTLTGRTTTLPANVTGLTVQTGVRGVAVAWTPCPDADYTGTELRLGASWAGAAFVWSGKGSAHTIANLASGTYTVRARHRNAQGNLSASDASSAFTWDALSGVAMQVEYSVTGASGWHSTFVTGDIYMRQSTDGGATWSAAIRIVGSDGLTTALVYIYKRSASAPALPSATVTYTFATGGITGLNNGWTATIPAGSTPLYVALATAAAAGPSDTIASGEWAAPVVLAQDGGPGGDGLNAATVYLFKRTSSATAPALPSTSTTYTFSTGIATGMNNGWTQSLPTSGGAYRWVTTGSALSVGATDTIAAGEWAAAAILAEDGAPGVDGADAISASLSASSVTLPADADGVVTSFASAVTTIKIMKGAANDTANWTISRTNGSGVSSTISGATVTVTALANDTGYVDVVATRSGYSTQTLRFGLAKAKSAAPGSGVVGNRYIRSDSTPGGAPANAGVKYRSDGTVQVKNTAGSYVAAGNWYSPTTAGIGASYWIKAVPRSGSSTLSSGTVGSWVSLASDQAWTNSIASGVSVRDTTADNYLATNSTGTETVATHVMQITADTT